MSLRQSLQACSPLHFQLDLYDPYFVGSTLVGVGLFRCHWCDVVSSTCRIAVSALPKTAILRIEEFKTPTISTKNFEHIASITFWLHSCALHQTFCRFWTLPTFFLLLPTTAVVDLFLFGGMMGRGWVQLTILKSSKRKSQQQQTQNTNSAT